MLVTDSCITRASINFKRCDWNCCTVSNGQFIIGWCIYKWSCAATIDTKETINNCSLRVKDCITSYRIDFKYCFFARGITSILNLKGLRDLIKKFSNLKYFTNIKYTVVCT